MESVSSANLSRSSAKMSFSVLVSLAKVVSRSPERARLWKESDRRWRWEKTSRRRE